MKVERRSRREGWLALPRTRAISVGLVAIAIGVTSCAQGASESTGTATRSPATATASSPAASPSPSDDVPTVFAQPGRPHDGGDVLTAMRDSRRPGGVASELQTDSIAAQVAEQLWTWNGEAWAKLTATGSCGAESCTLEVIGSAEGSAGADTYSFAVTTAEWQVRLVAVDLHGYPWEIEGTLDEMARTLLPPSELDGLVLASARWLPPPDAGQYWLSYRSGGEEGSPGLDVLLDAVRGVVVESRPPG